MWQEVQGSSHCVLLRSPSAPELAKDLEYEAASVRGFLMNLDRDVLGDAKAKVESSAKNTWRWEVLCGCLVIDLMEMV